MRKSRDEYVYAGLPLRHFLIQVFAGSIVGGSIGLLVLPSISGEVKLLAAICLSVYCPLYVASVRRFGFAFAARSPREPRRKQQAGHPRRRTPSQ